MKSKNYFKKILLFFIIVKSAIANAQPLSGTYTVGGVAPDYVTIGSASGALQSFGISGPVTFNIRDGFYNEKLIMYQFAGSSATNTVTFQSENGDSSLVIISDTSSATALNNFTIQIFGADNIKFKRVTIQRPGVNQYGTVVEIGNTSTNISLLNNQLIGGAGNSLSTTKCLLYTDSSNQNNDITITGNLFQNGNFGVYKQSYLIESGNIISNNIFQNQFAGAVYVYKQTGINISRNIISGNGSTNYRGISLNNSGSDCVTNKNNITINSGNAGIYYSSSTSGLGNENVAFNNFIHLAGNTTNAGFSLNNSQNIKLYHNSINLTTANSTSSAILVTGTSSGVQLNNNVFCNAGGGYGISVPSATALSVSDYNDFYTTGANLGILNSINAPILSDWIALSVMDSNSVSADPVFTSVSDLHASSVGINDVGTPLAAVSTDIDGDTRSATNPDIGADEFTPLTDNISMITILTPADYSCGDSNTIVSVVIQNLGLNNASAIPVTLEITGSSSLTLMDTVTGPMSSYETDTIVFTGLWNNYAGGFFTLKSYSSLPGDQYLVNDTLSENRTIVGIPATPTATSPQTFCAGDINITATTDSGNVLYWYDQSSDGNLVFTGNPFSPPLTGDTTFYVEAHSGIGTTGCLRITEIATEDPSTYDHIEIQNLSLAPINVTGWTVAASNSYTDINLENDSVWDLSSLGIIAPGQIVFKDDDPSSADYWGSNLYWSSSNPGWAVIIDNTGNVVDFAPWGWTSTDIANFNVTVNNFPITANGNWNGDGINGTCGIPDALTRIGNSDNDDANDFICTTSSKGLLNPGLNIPFPNCGASACGSDRIPVSIVVHPLPVVNLGADTTSGIPFTFDAGPGFSSYLWSTSATTQTIVANTTGTYYVVVTDANGCSATDTVNFISTVGINEINSISNFNVFPNPASDQFSISFYCKENQAFEIRLVNGLGEKIILQKRTSFTGAYNKIMNTGKFAKGVYNLQIITDDGILNRKITLE